MAVNDVALNTADHMSFSINKNLHLGSSINAVQQHLVGTENITPNNAVGCGIPLLENPADGTFVPAANSKLY
ncbi:hypothetical protein Tco_0958751 [Tanacetum coccineum]